MFGQLGQLERDLQAYLRFNNRERPHLGYRLKARTPAMAFRTQLESQVQTPSPNLTNWFSVGHCFWRSSWPGLDPPRHLYLFSARSLVACLKKASLAVQSVKTASPMAYRFWQVSVEHARMGHVPAASPPRDSDPDGRPGVFRYCESAWPWNAWAGDELAAVAVR